MQPDLIFDIGMHIGQDTEFYLAKGFRVVAVEANPVLAEQVRERLKSSIVSGRLVILNVGLAHERGELPFYINTKIDEWSSLNQKIASRGFPIKKIYVSTLTIADLLAQYGTPYYAKVDIEGFDVLAIDGLISCSDKPVYVSYENPNPDLFERLVASGYTRFKNVSQKRVEEYICPNPPREGKFVEWKFKSGSSGPFGDETPVPWLTAEEMRPRLQRLEDERLEALKKTIYPEWFDMHAGRVVKGYVI